MCANGKTAWSSVKQKTRYKQNILNTLQFHASLLKLDPLQKESNKQV